MARYFLGADGNLLVERRSSPRYDIELAIEVGFAADGSPIRGVTRNLSEAGVQVVLPAPLPTGGPIRIACDAFVGTTEEIWRREEGSEVRIGMQFVGLSPNARNAIQLLIAEARRERTKTLVAAPG
jgi:c-di-GMP-binding flagellar brake protein YcgR